MTSEHTYEAVKVTLDDGIAWVSLNRPAKRNAMNPTINREMWQVLDELEVRDDVGVVVLTGEGEAFSAGMDLKEYFRETEGESAIVQSRFRRAATDWMWRRLTHYPKATIAMVNGWCFGGAFTPLVACDLAIAADEATFGLSEINWGIIPAGNVTRAVAQVMNHRDSLYYIMTGDPFDGRKAAEMGLVNRSVPLADLRAETEALARKLLSKNPTILRHAKSAFKYVERLDWDTSEAMLGAMAATAAGQDTERGRRKGMTQFLDEKSFKPGLGGYRRED
ncbi:MULTISPECIES: p-hydroxycinnamoyl CoA hydratase/lyase [Sphingobium]|uniref:p-hydroxycinnamoyl CoA hydratase/lyase n=1 Tax=Sphingobium TaxID=165695 RepID=UPI0015EC2E73|nr:MULTISPECIES: p-hydroxycinnamoyl CoA hydratase/lyase [Sphingobium]MCW2362566.1 trans-feruloyl-CoA hydratase/vanillin synthase [Sphingobium sp. B10D3B]MCW2388766.1 trans-feruloyl-CoA hydratase/vanillin synthase [Sphingobium sp. B11D3B]MCW2400754.1 trans-feruloyl-CoA hydratase/vanillin synthase [Sphingobium sp. B10D7B]MCW2407733.1 trans-feruloyl-CoA hydratase/vanillin synthase [Sphingobium xanthum]